MCKARYFVVFFKLSGAAECWDFSRMLLTKHAVSIILNRVSHLALKLRVICIILGKMAMSVIGHFIYHP